MNTESERPPTPTSSFIPPQSSAVYWIEVEKIAPNPYQPRKSFNQEALQELAGSIREYGILEPLIVTRQEIAHPQGLEVRYELVAGERRLSAAKLAGLRVVPAMIKELSQRAKLELALIENLQRRDLNAIERARAFSRLVEEFALTQREIANRIGKSREYVSNTLRLLNLPEPVIQALESEKMTESQARLLLSVPDPHVRDELLAEVTIESLSIREMKRRISRKLVHRRPKEHAGLTFQQALDVVKTRLEEKLGTKVTITATDQGGHIAIAFYSPEELDRLIHALIGSPEESFLATPVATPESSSTEETPPPEEFDVSRFTV